MGVLRNDNSDSETQASVSWDVYVSLFDAAEIRLACERAGLDPEGDSSALRERLVATARAENWTGTQLLRRFRPAAVARVLGNHYPDIAGTTTKPSEALARIIEQRTGRATRFDRCATGPIGRGASVQDDLREAVRTTLLRSGWTVEDAPPRQLRLPFNVDGSTEHETPGDFHPKGGTRESDPFRRHNDLVLTDPPFSTLQGLPVSRSVESARMPRSLYSAVVKDPRPKNRDTLRAALSQAIAEARAMIEPGSGALPLGVIAVDSLTESMRADLAAYAAVVHPEASYGFIDAHGRTEFTWVDEKGTKREREGRIGHPVRFGTKNIGDLGELLGSAAGLGMLARILDGNRYRTATDLGTAAGGTARAGAEGRVSAPTAAAFVNALRIGEYLVPGEVALDPAKRDELLREARRLHSGRDPKFRAKLLWSFHVEALDDVLRAFGKAAESTGVEIALAASAALVHRGYDPAGPLPAPALVYVRVRDERKLLRFVNDALERLGRAPLQKCHQERSNLVLAAPPKRMGVFARCERRGALVACDDLCVYLDGRRLGLPSAWTGPAAEAVAARRGWPGLTRRAERALPDARAV